MKARRLMIDMQLKRKFSANKKLLMINRKKRKTEDLSSLGDQAGYCKNLKIQNVDGVDEGGKTLIAGSCKKGILGNSKLKRKISSILRKVLRGRKKQKMEKVENVDVVVEPVDLISELPEPMIHHILSRLRCPSDVARTSVLSKKWRSIWASFFTFDFDQKRFKTAGADHVEKFITFVDNSLATKLETMHSVHKFKISLFQASIELKLRMNNWISAALNKDVKELEIHVEEKKKRQFMLPNSVLSAKMLTSLRLYGCKFDEKIAVDLCNLKELSIKSSHVNGDVIQSFIRGCPLVEDLRLVDCSGIGRLHISTLLKLRTLELHECHGLVWVSIDLPNLITFLHRGKVAWHCEIHLEGCENLKYLTLKDPNLTDELFQDLITKFPSLEKIVLTECDQLKHITILSTKIKELSVTRCRKLEEANIDAPNLSLLEYSGERMPFSSMHIAGLHEAKLNLKNRKTRLARELLSFLVKFEIDRAWKLVVSSNKNVTIHEDLQKIPHLSSNDLKLELIKSPLKLKGYVNNLLRMSRPKSLSLVSSSSSDFLKDNIILLGPWGGSGGNHWDDGVHSGVREITLVYSSCIDSIRITYDNNGKPYQAEKHGGMGGTRSAQIKLKFPEEVLISVSGHYCPVVYGGGPVIRSLTFKSNQRTFGPFGVEEGTPFHFMTHGSHIVGFNGRNGWFLDSLGFCLSPPKTNIFHRFQMMFKAFHPHAVEDNEPHKTKGSNGYRWGI